MDTGDASGQHVPAPAESQTSADVGESPQIRAARIATTQTLAAARGGLRLWQSPLAAPARRSSRVLVERLSAQATRLQPVAAQALWRGVERAMASPLPEHLAGTLVEAGVLERMTAVLLKGDTLERVLDIAEREHVMKRLLEHSLTERFATELRASDQINRLDAALVPSDHTPDAAGAQPTDPDSGLTEKVGRAAGNTLERITRAVLPGPDQPTPTTDSPGDTRN